jgi:hypothetical protein
MIDFASVKSWKISEGEVVSVKSGGNVLWDKLASFQHKGSVSYGEETDTAKLFCGKNLGTRPNENIAFLGGGNGTPNTIAKIENNEIFYYDTDGSVAKFTEGNLNISFEGIQYRDTVTVRVEGLTFLGTYSWGYNNE